MAWTVMEGLFHEWQMPCILEAGRIGRYQDLARLRCLIVLTECAA
jgi:hypothetical protein